MLEITTPPGCTAEREYVLGVIFEDWLGLSYNLQQADVAATTVRLADQPGEMGLPDTFFSQFVEGPGQWLEEASMPSQPLQRWDSRALAVDITLVDPVLPVIFGEPIAGDAVAPSPNQSAAPLEPIIRLPIDILGSAFFMLSRYEEVVRPDRDEHDRFPAWASLAYQEGFLERPIIDEYVEILWAAISALWPWLQRRQHIPKTFVTCDVDNPYAAYTKTWQATIRKMGGDALKRRSFTDALRSVRNTVATRRGDYSHDPLWTFDWMMDVNENAGNRIAFYFLCDHTVAGFDGHYRLNEPRIRELIRLIHKRGHEIGLHGSYGTYRNPRQMAREADRLGQVLESEGIEQAAIGARQHYLRWQQPTTAKAIAQAGITYDSTIGYADWPGFRCGTSRSFPMFDLLGAESTGLIERPLIVMECSVLSSKYMGLNGAEGARDYFYMLKDRTYKYGGEFSLLWHNSFFLRSEYKDLYASVISQ